MKILDLLKRRSPQDRFAERAMKAVRAAGWAGPLSYNRDAFQLDLGEGAWLSLGNIFLESETPQEQDKVINEAIALFLSEPDLTDFATVSGQILPRIHNRAQVETWDDGGADPQLSRPLVGPLTVLLVVDQPTGMHIISESMARDWGCSYETLLAVATANLRARSLLAFERTPEGFFLAKYEDHYDASRLLLLDLLQELPLEGKPVVVAVARSILTVVGSEDILGLNAMADFVDHAVRNQPRSISYTPLVLEDGAWRPFAPRTYGLGAIRLLWVKQALWDYAVQADSLQARPAVTENRIFVAPLEAVVEDPDIHTWTSWHEGGRAWLPKADAIGLTRKDGVRIMRAWADVEAVCGAFQVLPDAWPERYLAQAWPSDDQWAELSARTTPAWFPA